MRAVTRRVSLITAVTSLGLLLASPPAPAATGRGSANVEHLANIRYPSLGASIPNGSDLEFATLTHNGQPKAFAVAGSLGNGLHLIDISNPASPVRVSTYDCRANQGDTQIIQRGGRTYTTFAVDSSANTGSACFRDVGYSGGTSAGAFIIDITDPTAPKAISRWAFSGGSHNMTVHPGGQYMYNSANDLDGLGRIEIIDISNLASPTTVGTLQLPTGVDSHDITFNTAGTRAYSAALSHSLVIDTTKPASPRVISSIVDPSISIHHQADPVTITDPILGTRDFLVVTDEAGGGSLSHVCPGGGLHVFDVTGPLELAPVKVGYFVPGDYGATATGVGGLSASASGCTAHVLRMHPAEKIMTIAWYGAGVRVLDISGLVGASVSAQRVGYGYSGNGIDVSQNLLLGSTGAGIKELGWYTFPNSDTWSAKTNSIAADGSFYLFANDMKRGFDVYRYTKPAPQSAVGTASAWTPATATLPAASAAPSATADVRLPYCALLSQRPVA